MVTVKIIESIPELECKYNSIIHEINCSTSRGFVNKNAPKTNVIIELNKDLDDE